MCTPWLTRSMSASFVMPALWRYHPACGIHWSMLRPCSMKHVLEPQDVEDYKHVILQPRSRVSFYPIAVEQTAPEANGCPLQEVGGLSDTAKYHEMRIWLCVFSSDWCGLWSCTAESPSALETGFPDMRKSVRALNGCWCCFCCSERCQVLLGLG